MADRFHEDLPRFGHLRALEKFRKRDRMIKFLRCGCLDHQERRKFDRGCGADSVLRVFPKCLNKYF